MKSKPNQTMETETKKTESVQEVLTVTEISAEALYELNKAYNPAVWKEKIDRLARQKDCKFYHAKPQRGYEYDRFYAVYEVEEGIIFFNEVSYSSALTSNGFCRITIAPDGTVRRFLLKDGSGKEGHCENDRANRSIMAKNSKETRAIFSNQF